MPGNDETNGPRSTPSPADRWTRVVVSAPTFAHEPLIEALLQPPVTGIEEDGERLVTYVLALHDGAAFRDDLRRRLLAAAAAAGLAPERLELAFEDAAGRDWERAWRESLRPFRVGRFAIVPRRHDGPLRDGDVRLVLEPAGSYGTGRHPSTRFALRFLSETLRESDRVLDAGTGSGILAVAAVRLGAASALGFDNDPNSEPTARELAEDNDATARCEFRTCGFEGVVDAGTASFDVVLANLHADLLQRYAADLASFVRPGGHLIASGIRVEERLPTREAFRAAGLSPLAERAGRKWMAILARRSGA